MPGYVINQIGLCSYLVNDVSKLLALLLTFNYMAGSCHLQGRVSQENIVMCSQHFFLSKGHQVLFISWDNGSELLNDMIYFS